MSEIIVMTFQRCVNKHMLNFHRLIDTTISSRANVNPWSDTKYYPRIHYLKTQWRTILLLFMCM